MKRDSPMYQHGARNGNGIYRFIKYAARVAISRGTTYLASVYFNEYRAAIHLLIFSSGARRYIHG